MTIRHISERLLKCNPKILMHARMSTYLSRQVVGKRERVHTKTFLLASASICLVSYLFLNLRSEKKESLIVDKKNQGVLLIDQSVNLLNYPSIRKLLIENQKQVTIGDLHANALKLLHFLIKENLISMPKKDYLDFAQIYQKENSSINKEDLTKLIRIIQSINFLPLEKGSMIRFLGDEFCDRGENDYYILKIFEKMHQEQVPFEILFSNHGYELISVFERGILKTSSCLEAIGCGSSLTHFRKFIEQGLVSLEEVNFLITKVYYPHVKLVSVTADKKGDHCDFTVYSHAPITLKTIRMLSANRNFGFSLDSIETNGLDRVVSLINKKFQKYLTDGLVFKQFDREIRKENSDGYIPYSLPVKKCIFSRSFGANDEPLILKENHRFSYVHGHNGNGFVDIRFNDYVINLDNLLGKGRGLEKKSYSVYVSTETSLIL